jgi:MHS family proline/betaine transporter-like MFS transporter
MEHRVRAIAAAEEEVSTHQVVKAAVASVFGWALDLFDLFIILYLAPYIGANFFSSRSPMLSLAAVYAAFAVSLVMRPAGSALFGWFADGYGRKRAMVVAVIGVGIATATMGAVPTTESIGLVAPVVFLLLRLIQGIFVGGVVASTHTIGVETVPARWRGMLSGLVGAGGAGLAGLLAAGVFYVLSAALGGPEFASWGWRLMFFSGILSSVLGLFIFRSLEESPLWSMLQQARSGKQKAPLKALLSRQYGGVLLLNVLLCAGGATQYYLTSGFLPTFLAVVNHLPKVKIGMIMALSNTFVLLTGPLFGHLSEVLGRRSMFIAAGLTNLVVLPLAYSKLALLGGGAGDVGTAAALAALLAASGNAGCAPIVIFLNERFPTEIRATGTGVSWNFGFAIGGTMPALVTLASRQVANLPNSLVVFLVAALAVYVAVAFALPETSGRLT